MASMRQPMGCVNYKIVGELDVSELEQIRILARADAVDFSHGNADSAKFSVSSVTVRPGPWLMERSRWSDLNSIGFVRTAAD